MKSKPSSSRTSEQPESQENPLFQQFIPTKFEILLSYIGVLFFAYYISIQVGIETQKFVYNTESPIKGVEEGLFGYMKDTSDRQWRHYSDSFHITLAAAIAFFVIKTIIQQKYSNENEKFTKLIPIVTKFYIIYGTILIIIMFHAGALCWAAISYFYLIFTDQYYQKNWFPFVLWVSVIFNLYIIEATNGFDLQNVFNPFGLGLIFDLSKNDDSLVRWNVIFNMTLLRIISFAMDQRWAYLELSQQQALKDQSNGKKISSTQKYSIENNEEFHFLQKLDTLKDDLQSRYKASLPINQYNLSNYFAYLLYSPIFLSGPPITFNAWLSQIYKPLPSLNLNTQIKYTIRTTILLVSFEIWLHINYSYALCTQPENRTAWKSMNTLPLMVAGFGVLMFVWFQFNSFWKVSRCWALWDDIEVPENLNRCICNNYNFQGFWRSWHRGFNQWLVRYLFIPLGGSKTQVWNIWIIFIFVALWHDFNLNLILWAVGICLFLMPEIIVKNYFQQEKFSNLRMKRWWWFLSSLVATFYVLLMIFANLIGFGIGWESLQTMLLELLSTQQGIIASTYVILAIMSAIQYMFYKRIKEEQAGNYQGF